jgi:acyl dehydratase
MSAPDLGSPPPPVLLGPITRTDIVRYQGASGDFQPIHHDEPYALAAGLSAPLVVGMYPAGVLTLWATQWLGAENVRRVRLRWRDMVWPGDILSCGGRVVRTFAAADGPRVEFELAATRGDSIVLSAWMEFVVA